MFDLPDLVFVLLVIGAVWYGWRWLQAQRGLGPRAGRGRPQQPHQSDPRRAAGPPGVPAEDLVSCRACGSYVAAGAAECRRPGCPHPR